MKSIEISAQIEELWQLLRIPSTEVNRIIAVLENGNIIGIVTDSEIRKFVVSHNSLPRQIKDVMRSDFIHVYENSNKDQMAHSIANQLGKRKIKDLHVVNEILVVSEHGTRLIPITEFSTELALLQDRTFIIGLGFVGLTLFAVLFSKYPKSRIFGIEKNIERVQRLLNKDYYILEPGLINYLQGLEKVNLASSIEETSESLTSGLRRSIYIIAVETPVNKEGSPLLESLFLAARDIAQHLRKGDVLIIRSTIPIGTSRRIANMIELNSGLRVGLDFHLGYAPERTVEGDALREVEALPQIVAGVTESCVMKVREIAHRWSNSVLEASSLEVAEMIKLSNNAFRDHHFAFANELALIAHKNGVDIEEVIRIANLGYSRSNIPWPSPGVGGPCLTKDSYMLLSSETFEETRMQNATNYSTHISSIFAARKLNELMPTHLARLILTNFAGENEKQNQGLIIGLAFKGHPPTNDCRNSPSIENINLLHQQGLGVFCWDAELTEIEVRNLGLRPIPDSNGSGVIAPIFCVIGNNHSKNLAKTKDLVAKFSSIKLIFDPWDLIRQSGELGHFKSQGVAIRNLSVEL